jgi:hypothetical protein
MVVRQWSFEESRYEIQKERYVGLKTLKKAIGSSE